MRDLPKKKTSAKRQGSQMFSSETLKELRINNSRKTVLEDFLKIISLQTLKETVYFDQSSTGQNGL